LRGALLGQALGDLQAVHRVHPGEVLGDGPGLVRLDGPDEVPDQVQVGQLGLLGQGFLQVVLAEVALAGGMCLAYGLRRLGLAHGEQTDCLRIALRGLRRLTDTAANLCNILCYRGHYLRSLARPSGSAAFYPLALDWGVPWILPSCSPSAPSRARRTCTSRRACRR